MAIMLQRKPTPLQSWHLATKGDMLDALEELEGWRGAMSTDEHGVWRLELNNNGHPTVIAALGQWLVLDGADLKALTDAERAAAYDTVED